MFEMFEKHPKPSFDSIELKFLSAKNSASGFTLIELMIVVGIIGILASIAVPNFSKYQAKARQTEAKIALSNIYTAEKSFYGEYTAFTADLTAIGFAAEGQKRNYNVGFTSGADANNPTNSTIGYGGSFSAAGGYSAAVNNTISGCSGTLTAVGQITSANGQTFNASASGCIHSSSAADVWRMSETKFLTNTNTGY